MSRGGAGRASSLAARLRAETRPEHDAIEATLGWERRAASRDAYRDWLRRLYALHAAWEPAVAAAIHDPDFFDPRRKLHLLADDLQRLGGTDTLPLPDQPSRFASRAAALGSMYVIEGSTLGGRLIARRVRDKLAFEPRYHAAYGDAAGAMWRAFRDRIDRDVEAEHHDVAVAAARATFRSLADRLA